MSLLSIIHANSPRRSLDGAFFEPAAVLRSAKWHERLSEEDKELVRTLADVVASAHKDAAEYMAGTLPPAPRCPL